MKKNISNLLTAIPTGNKSKRVIYKSKKLIQNTEYHRISPIKRFKFFNTRECGVDNVIQLIQCRVRSRCHLNVKELFISGSVHIIVLPSALFGILYFSQRCVIRAAMRSDGIEL